MKYALVFWLLVLSFSLRSQPSTDIYLFDIELKNSQLKISGHKNITNRDGYDNQPTFDKSSSTIYYTSIRDSQSNVFLFNIETEDSRQLTFTPESEYSPTPLGDGSFSTVRVDLEGVQHLWKIKPYPFQAKKVFDDITGIGYHEWLSENELALFIVGEPHEMHIAQIDKGNSEKVAESIGSALHKVPNRNAVAYMDFSDSTDCRIRVYDLEGKVISDLCPCAPESEYFVYFDQGHILSVSARKLFLYSIIDKQKWEMVHEFKEMEAVSFYRINISPDRQKLVLVSRAEQ